MRAWQQQARVWLWPTVVLSSVGLGSCGGSASSRPHGATGGASPNSAGASGASTPGAGTGAGGVERPSGGTGNQLNDAGQGGASAGANPTANVGGAGGETSNAGAAGNGDCVDVCELHGEACCVPESCVSADASCVIDVFDDRVSTTYDYAVLEQKVATLSQTFSASISTADIVSSAADPFPSARIELHLSAAASSLHAAALEGGDLHPFRVSCGGERLFVGLVYKKEGAAALALPVLDVAREADDALVLRLGAWQSAWLFPSRTDDNLPARARLDRPELRSTLCLSSAPQEL
jgi:hypothetical protein